MEPAAVTRRDHWFYITSSKGTVQLVAGRNIFYEDINSHERRITWRCSKFYTRTPERDRCQVSICLRSGLISYVKGCHNHPDTYVESKHASRRCEVDKTGKYKITGKWVPGQKPEISFSDMRSKVKDLAASIQKVKNRNLLTRNTNSEVDLFPIGEMKNNVTIFVSKNNSDNTHTPVPPSNNTTAPMTNNPGANENNDQEVAWHIPTFEGFL